MPPSDGVLSVADTAARLGVSNPRIIQLLKEQCSFLDPPIFELDSPEGRPTGTTHVSDRSITLSSIAAYEERHPWLSSGKRRKRHPAADKARPTSSVPGDKGGDKPPPSRGSSGVQVLRLELEHQLNLNQQLVEKLEGQEHEAVERARALRHQIVDLEADLELTTNSAESLVSRLAGLQSAFNAYGEVFTQDVGPQDSSGT